MLKSFQLKDKVLLQPMDCLPVIHIPIYSPLPTDVSQVPDPHNNTHKIAVHRNISSPEPPQSVEVDLGSFIFRLRGETSFSSADMSRMLADSADRQVRVNWCTENFLVYRSIGIQYSTINL